MPLSEKGKEVKKSMEESYGKEKGDQVFYATENKGEVKGLTKNAWAFIKVTAADLARVSEGIDLDKFDREQLAEGAKVELEHGSDAQPERIAADHMAENGAITEGVISSDYYDKLHQMEQNMRSGS